MSKELEEFARRLIELNVNFFFFFVIKNIYY